MSLQNDELFARMVAEETETTQELFRQLEIRTNEQLVEYEPTIVQPVFKTSLELLDELETEVMLVWGGRFTKLK